MNPRIQLPGSTRLFAILTISALFILWCLAFLARGSFTAIDSKIYCSMFDDALISMRYAWNLANGNGLVWNPGEYVQGYSNLLMTLFMSLVHLVFDKRFAVMAINASGIVFMLLIAFATSRIAGYLYHDASSRENDIASIIAFALALCYSPLAYWSLMGMETGMLAMLLTFAVLYVFKYEHGGNIRYLYLATILLSLAVLTRNETVIFGACIGGYAIVLFRHQERKKHIPQLLAAMALYLATGLGLLLFQYNYYGEWLPNTYTLKISGIPLSHRLVNGFFYVAHFLLSMAIIISYIVDNMKQSRTRGKLLVCCIAVAAVLYTIYIGGDAFRYFRITAPVIPLVMALFAVGMVCRMKLTTPGAVVSDQNAGTLPTGKNKFRSPRARATVGILLAMLVANIYLLPQLTLIAKPSFSRTTQDITNKAIILDQILSAEATIGVFAAGTVPYYSGRVGIDFLGKMDKYIARVPPDLSGTPYSLRGRNLPGHNKYDLEYSIGQLKPVYASNLHYLKDNIAAKGAIRDYAHITTTQGYKFYLLRRSPHVDWQKLQEYVTSVE